MANHKVDMTEVRAFKEDINELMTTLQEQMDEVKTAINHIKQMDSFKGKAADEAKAYFEVMHETLLTAFQGMCSQLEANVTKHVKDFQGDIDADHHTIITTGYIKDRKDSLEDKHDQFHELTEQVQRILSEVSDITNAHSPSIDATDEDKHHSVQVMKKLNNNIDAFATNYRRDEAQIENAMQEIKQFLDRRVQLGAIAATDSFTHTLPQMRIQLSEAKENVAFNRMLLSQEDRDRQNILGMRDSLVLDRQGGLGAYGLGSSNPMSIGEAISKSVNSGKEIGASIWDGIETRNEKKFDSAYDFINYLTVGLPDGVINMYHASDARYQAMKNDVSIRTVLNYMTIGTTGMIEEAFNPEDPLSAEHWMNSFGTVSLFTGGMLAWKKGGGTSPKINYTDKKIEVDKGADNLNTPYMGVKQASEYLKSQGVPRQFRKPILESFEIGTIKLDVAGSNTYGLRFYDDINASAKGRYLFETFSPQVNRSNLALPPDWNKMTGVQQWQVKPDTIIIKGKAGPQFQMGNQYIGGVEQWYITNLDDLIKP